MGDERLRLHDFLPRSRANGPGFRAVIWVQGCSLGCPGCFNPGTHSLTGGQDVAVGELLERLLALGGDIEGLTVSGGEPLQQMQPLLALLGRVRNKSSYSVLLFTGYTWEQVRRMPRAKALLAGLDVLIAGPYDASQRLVRGLCGSANQTVHLLSGRYTMEDLRAVPPAEIVITAEGEILFSGVDPPMNQLVKLLHTNKHGLRSHPFSQKPNLGDRVPIHL